MFLLLFMNDRLVQQLEMTWRILKMQDEDRKLFVLFISSQQQDVREQDWVKLGEGGGDWCY